MLMYLFVWLKLNMEIKLTSLIVSFFGPQVFLISLYFSLDLDRNFECEIRLTPIHATISQHYEEQRPCYYCFGLLVF